MCRVVAMFAEDDAIATDPQRDPTAGTTAAPPLVLDSVESRTSAPCLVVQEVRTVGDTLRRSRSLMIGRHGRVQVWWLMWSRFVTGSMSALTASTTAIRRWHSSLASETGAAFLADGIESSRWFDLDRIDLFDLQPGHIRFWRFDQVEVQKRLRPCSRFRLRIEPIASVVEHRHVTVRTDDDLYPGVSVATLERQQRGVRAEHRHRRPDDVLCLSWWPASDRRTRRRR